MEKQFENNQVSLLGEIASKFEFSHEVYNEKFYLVEVITKRLSSFFDHIPVMISEKLIDVTKDYRGQCVKVNGTFRSYNRHTEGNYQLVLYVFVQDIEFTGDIEVDTAEDSNNILLDGYLCKPPVYRKTPLGREITDILVAVNRSYGKSDYIPCICWGRNATYAATFEVGEHVKISGRIQSREYKKKISDTDVETRTAYEVSVSSIKK
jgi:single-stranded DNA-binding protein